MTSVRINLDKLRELNLLIDSWRQTGDVVLNAAADELDALLERELRHVRAIPYALPTAQLLSYIKHGPDEGEGR